MDNTDVGLYGPFINIPALPADVLSDDNIDNTFGFAGYIYTYEWKSYLARHRWYDAELGRWLQRDPAGYVDGMSLYLYALSNPLVFVDPLGLWGWFENLCDGAVGLFIGTSDFDRNIDGNEKLNEKLIKHVKQSVREGGMTLEEGEKLIRGLSEHQAVIDKAITDLHQARADAAAGGAVLIPAVGPAIAVGIEVGNAGVDVAQGDYGDAALRGGGALIGGVLDDAIKAGNRLISGGTRTADNVVDTSLATTKTSTTTARGGGGGGATGVATRAAPENPTAYSTWSEQAVTGTTRQAHRRQANQQLYQQLENSSGMRSAYNQSFGVDVMAHMRSGRSGLLNPPGMAWHHPASARGVVQLVPQRQHTAARFQPVLHPGGRGGYVQFWAD